MAMEGSDRASGSADGWAWGGRATGAWGACGIPQRYRTNGVPASLVQGRPREPPC